MDPVASESMLDRRLATDIQQQFWLAAHQYPSAPVNTAAQLVRLEGRLDTGCMRLAIRNTIEAMPALRVYFTESAGHVIEERASIEDVMPAIFTVVDMVGSTLLAAKDEALRMVREPFPLGSPPLVRLRLFALSPSSWLLLFCAHSAVCDDRTSFLFGRRLSEAYRRVSGGSIPAGGSAETQPIALVQPLAPQDDLDAVRSWWVGRLSDTVPFFELPGAQRHQEMAVEASHVHIDLGIVSQGEARGGPAWLPGELSAVAVAAVGVFCARLSGQRSVTVGFPIDTRTEATAEDGGCYENILPVPVNVDLSSSFSTLVAQVATAIGEMRRLASTTPLETLLRWLGVPRLGGTTPLLQVVCAVDQVLPLALEGVRSIPMVVDVPAQQPEIVVSFRRTGDSLSCRMCFRRDVFADAAIGETSARFQRVFHGLCGAPEAPVGDSDLCVESDLRTIRRWNETTAETCAAPDTAHFLYDCMGSRGGAEACRCGTDVLSYDEIERLACRIASVLHAAGLRGNEPVGVLVGRSASLPAVLYGVWKAGAAYVPLDPQLPLQRHEYMVEDSGMRFVLADRAHAAQLAHCSVQILVTDDDDPHAGDSAAITVDTHPDDRAYIMYTSGSTGLPKGVEVPHRAVLNFLLSMRKRPGLTSSDVLLSVTTYSFDISVLELFLPLVVGARLIIADQPSVPLKVRQLLQRYPVNVMQATPITWQMLLAAGWEGSSRLVALCGGEALKPTLARALLPKVAQLWNMYGPTETTVWSACRRIASADEQVGVGSPIDNTTFYIADERMRLLPPGCAGELCIGGVGVALGYHNRSGLTAQRFVPDTFGSDPRGFLYRTGDRARLSPDGDLEILGRVDNQVKVRGFRIELEEVEAVLAACPGIDQAAVAAWDEGGVNVLAGYYTPESTTAGLEADDLRRHCAKRLPDYMIPSYFVRLNELPLTPNGKVNRKDLPRPQVRIVQNAYDAPMPSAVMQQVAAAWQEVLGLKTVGFYENFFDAGGSSLRSFQLVRRLEAIAQKRIPLVAVFQYPTIAAQARYLASNSEHQSPTVAARQRASRFRESMVRAGRSLDVAIVGMAGRFPGAPDTQRLWRNLCDGVESITVWERPDLDPLVDSRVRNDPAYVPARGVIEGVDRFDSLFFGINPSEARLMDPQLRHFLEVAWTAFEDAGIVGEEYDGTVGVFAGMGNNFYYHHNVLTNAAQIRILGEITAEILNEKDHIAPQVSYRLNLTGPSLSVHTACSTTLVVVENAWRSLVTGQCDVALAGGVDIRTPQRSGQLYEEGGIFSKDGHCRPFDAEATGTMFGEAVGAIVMMRVDDALRLRYPIYAVVRGAAVNHDGGTKVGYLAPSLEAQMRVIAEAQAVADVSADTVSYVEAHGTATPIGDPIEFEALCRVFREDTRRQGYCGLGSVKANLGHTTTAAGITAVIKVALMLCNSAIPPQINFSEPNSRVALEGSPFFVTTALRPWKTDGHARRAGVSSFGFCGTNAHVVLQEPPSDSPMVREPKGPQSEPILLLLSARSATALDAMSTTFAAWMESTKEDPRDVAYTLSCGRKRFEHRRALACRDAAEGALLLRQPMRGRVVDRRSQSHGLATAFMFPGQGSQYAGMGQEIYAHSPEYMADVDSCAEILRHHMHCDIRDHLFGPSARGSDGAETIQDTAYAQPALFVTEFALARLWMRWGVHPAALIGHSIGEFVAATLAGVFDLDQALKLVATRAELMQALPRGSMLSVRRPAAEVEPLLPRSLAIASENSPQLCVVSGPTEALASFQAELEAAGTPCRPLHTSHAFHSAMMDPVVEPFAAVVKSVSLRAPAIPIASTVTGGWMTPADACNPMYWAEHLRRTVRFSAAVQVLVGMPDTVLLEAGPRTVTATLARQHFSDAAKQVAISSLGQSGDPRDDWVAVHTAMGELWCAGVNADWRSYHDAAERAFVHVPTYRFDPARHWMEPGDTKVVSTPVGAELPTTDSEIGGVSPAERDTVPAAVEEAVDRVKAILSRLTGRDYSNTEDEASFLDLGLDSLLITQLSRALQEEFGVKVSFKRLMQEVPTIRLVAAEILALHGDRPTRSPQAVAAASMPPGEPVLPDDSSDLSALRQRVAEQAQTVRHLTESLRQAGIEPISRTATQQHAEALAVPQAGASATGPSQPPIVGARLGRDSAGNPAWFVPDPDRPGKYRKVGRG